MIRFGLILMTICIIASFVLTLTYNITKPLIADQAKEEEKLALKEALADADEFKEMTIDNIRYFKAYKDNRLVGYVLDVKSKGYADIIYMFVGIDLAGVIKGIKIISHQETPGLGSQMTDIRYGEKEPWFTRQFKRRRSEELDFKNIQAITGATISSTAVLDGVKQAITEFLSKVK